MDDNLQEPTKKLRKGWTTGACATAATKASLIALFGKICPEKITIKLPRGQEPEFAIHDSVIGSDFAQVSIIKDAGDDPDVTHLAEITVHVQTGSPNSGVKFIAGEGVGTVTLPGLPVAVGEPAINPVPKAMMMEIVSQICQQYNKPHDIIVTISIPNGEKIAVQTWNPRIGIIGGLSILGTTGIVHPFSCSAWISSIHSGIDVCRANGINNALAATGSTSQAAAVKRQHFSEPAILDMGDFIGGVLKYLRRNPLSKITLAGGFAKFTKFANGAMDLHSGRSQVDFIWLSEQAAGQDMNHDLKLQIQNANTAMHVLELIQNTDIDLPKIIAQKCYERAISILRDADIEVEILIVSRHGEILAQHG